MCKRGNMFSLTVLIGRGFVLFDFFTFCSSSLFVYSVFRVLLRGMFLGIFLSYFFKIVTFLYNSVFYYSIFSIVSIAFISFLL